ncbi:MAG: response regulator transcription factor [Patescibacteria group bacterium]
MRVLLIEDEEGIASFIKKALKAEGFCVDTTPSAEKGLFWGKTNDYDLAILDIMLPDGDGLEVCKELRAVKKNIPILMLTVKNEIQDKVQALNLGADDYLTKPFALEELVARIRAVMRRPQEVKTEIFKYKDLVLDAKKHSLVYGNKKISLRTKEFALLEYLMRNLGVVISRSMILEHVWDMNADPFTNTVDVHIRALRKKLNDPAGQLVRTVHGKGYKVGE